ncbi:MAG: YibE/F family protein [Negativicutes bacterium]|nr:YibE/F family protein [Negativicutes bacterium]
MRGTFLRYGVAAVSIAGILLGLWWYLSFSRNEGVFEVAARVTHTEDDLQTFGLIKQGTQLVTAEIAEGPHRGKVIQGHNHVQGKLELDHIMQPGDMALFAVKTDQEGRITQAYVIDYARHHWELALFGAFFLILIFVGGVIGVKAFCSFVLSVLVIWQVFLPGIMAGYNPIAFTLLTVALISFIIIFSVLGFSRKAVTAFGGTMAGLMMTAIFTLYFGEHFYLNGATAAFAENFLYSGGYSISLKLLFYAAIILGASGAAVDVAIDIAAAMTEVVRQNPLISRDELIQSGFNVGRAVIGAMATTLLLAYSGGYIMMLLLFMTKDMSLLRVLNVSYVAAEILRTLTGSIGLVLVVPFTAVLGGYLILPRREPGKPV